jgi:hypothetical protein
MVFGAVQTRLSALPKKKKESWRLICSDALWLTFFILLPTTHSNHHQNNQQTRG